MKEIKNIPILERVTKKNEQIAAEIRGFLHDKKIISFNFMGSPGGGKTTLIEETIKRLHGKKRVAVIEGDLATTIDAERIRNYGVKVLQINTGAMCHLDARLIHQALEKIDLSNVDFLFIENVGNLVCPSAHDLGEDYRIILASVPEGPHKPKKYPVIYKEADVVVITKADLLEHFPDFKTETLIKHAKEIKPDIETFIVSLKGDKIIIDEWISWIEKATPKER